MPQEEVVRPITIHVQRFGFDDLDMSHIERRRISTIDAEISNEQAKALIKFLEARLNSKLPGAIRFRMFGNLVG